MVPLLLASPVLDLHDPGYLQGCRLQTREEILHETILFHTYNMLCQRLPLIPSPNTWDCMAHASPIHYRTTHTWRLDHEKKSLKNTSWDWLIAICLTMDALCDPRLQVWTRWESTMVVVEMAMEVKMAAARVCRWRWWWMGCGCAWRSSSARFVDISTGSP